MNQQDAPEISTNANRDSGADAARSRSIALRPLRILEAIAGADGPVAVLDVARQVGVDRSTAYRILVSLTEEGYVAKDSGGTRYVLAHKVLWLAKSLLDQDDSNALINETLAALAGLTGETVHFSVLDGHVAILTHSAKGKQRLSVDVAIGDRAPLHATSAGKILLAYSAEGLVEEVVGRGLGKFAANTITEPESLHAELERIREQGFAYDLHEFADDMQCVAVPVFGRRGKVHGTISFSGPDSRFTLDQLNRLKDAARPAAATLSQALSGPP